MRSSVLVPDVASEKTMRAMRETKEELRHLHNTHLWGKLFFSYQNG
jgi:hypothetical protein